MPPLPVAQVLRGRVELARGIDHVVVLKCRARGSNAGAVRLVERRLFLIVRLPRVGVRQVSLLVRFQPFPGHATQATDH